MNLFIRILRKTENHEPLLVYESTRLSKSIKNKIVKLKG